MHFEILEREIGDGVALTIGDNRVDIDVVDLDAERWRRRVGGRLRVCCLIYLQRKWGSALMDNSLKEIALMNQVLSDVATIGRITSAMARHNAQDPSEPKVAICSEIAAIVGDSPAMDSQDCQCVIAVADRILLRCMPDLTPAEAQPGL